MNLLIFIFKKIDKRSRVYADGLISFRFHSISFD